MNSVGEYQIIVCRVFCLPSSNKHLLVCVQNSYSHLIDILFLTDEQATERVGQLYLKSRDPEHDRLLRHRVDFEWICPAALQFALWIANYLVAVDSDVAEYLTHLLG